MARYNEHRNARKVGIGLVLAVAVLISGAASPFAHPDDQDGPPPELLLSNGMNLYITAKDKKDNGAGDPTNDYKAAIGYFYQYMSVAPDISMEDSAKVYNKLARSYYDIAEVGSVEDVPAYWDSAATSFQWLIDRNPEGEYLAGNYLFAGFAVYQISGMTAAVPFYESYVELEPDDLAQREYLIRMLMAQGDHQKATDHAMTYLEKNPQNDGVVDNLLNLRSRLQPRWLEITTALVEKRPDTPKYLLDMAQYHYDRVENPQTLEFARRYTQAQPEDPTGWMLLGDANKRMGQHQQAQQAFDRILRIEPNNVRAHTDKAATYMDQGQLERAWRSAGTALRLDPENAYANAVMGDAAYRHLMQKLNTEKPGTDLDKMPFNYREYIKDIVVERYYNKARSDPQWRDYVNNQIAYLSQFFPQPQDRFMAPPEDRVKIEFPPPA